MTSALEGPGFLALCVKVAVCVSTLSQDHSLTCRLPHDVTHSLSLRVEERDIFCFLSVKVTLKTPFWLGG